jgi:N utilization substance protein B
MALQVLYAFDLACSRRAARGVEEHTAEPSDSHRVFGGVAENFEAPARAQAFASELVEQVAARGQELDATIAVQACNWRISRMAAVDRNILRIGAYELCHTDTPAAVVLNEAIELARRFGSDNSPAFVNGILDAVARAVREDVRSGTPGENNP